MAPSNKRKRADTLNSPDQALPAGGSNNAQARVDNSKKMVAACTACRKQKVRQTVQEVLGDQLLSRLTIPKIKCDMPNEDPPCTRCERRKLPCVLHNAARPGGADMR